MNGDDPRIETFLADAPETAHDGLLAELLAMELEYLSHQGDDPHPDNYVQRFPQKESVIADVFRSHAKTPLPGNKTESERSDAGVRTIDAPPDLDNFRLIEKIGHGGMGVVWLAEQNQPVKRRVALKLIRSELASREVLPGLTLKNRPLP